MTIDWQVAGTPSTGMQFNPSDLMIHVPKSLVMLLLMLSSITIAPRVHSEMNSANIVFKGPTFQYILRKDHDPIICRHMLQVFNDKFAHLWDTPELIDSTYSADSKYAFPRLPGVQHSARITYDMAFSAQPTSPEFSAIHWMEGRVISGGCPEGKTCPEERPEPILVAYFDFDNDGSVDTVIKEGGSFFSYTDMSRVHEYLTVWRRQRLKITDASNLWSMAHPADKKLTPIILSGTYLRPFIYRGKTYVANYGADLEQAPKEVMAIETYSFTGRTEAITGRPQWSGDAICDLEMNRLKN